MSWYRLVKLVRDGVGQWLPEEAQGAVVYTPIRDPAEARRMRREKLLEEAVEFVSDPSIEELADVYEAVRCLAEYHPEYGSFDAVIGVANQKRAQRGAFELGMGMYVITTPPDGRGDPCVEM